MTKAIKYWHEKRGLLALDEEFDDLSFATEDNTISVVTQAITLQEIELGRFEIRLDWSDSTERGTLRYRMIALDPNPSYKNEDVTHPHVHNEELCEGEGNSSIRSVLEAGRLFDFFTIVRNILCTCNSSSPHVSLNNWFGAECCDCGDSVNNDDLTCCQRCELQTCRRCAYFCNGCDSDYCNECVTSCEDCSGLYCSACMPSCDDCQKNCCSECLIDDERCSDCHEQYLENEESENESTTNQTDPEVHSDRLGETPVSA